MLKGQNDLGIVQMNDNTDVFDDLIVDQEYLLHMSVFISVK